jgi:peptidoglycan/LPS O-acetylase OafA/YrhL
MIKYRPEIDGLRAIAVVVVILFHSGVSLFGGGFVGVDVFFVISGYLITSIIQADLVAARFSFRKFYERRARRILPGLFLVSISTVPFALLWLLPDQLLQYGGSQTSTSLYYSNFYFWRLSGYFDTSSELQPLLHTWSLSVEEQYYIVFPLLMLILWRWLKSATLALVSLGVIASFVVAEYGAQRGSLGAYYLLPTRAWELGLGSILAMLPGLIPELRAISRQILSWVGLVLILVGAILYRESTPYPGVYALTPTLGAVLVIAMTRSTDLLGRFLGCKLLVSIGLVSYSLYLWHQPVLAFARQRLFTDPTGLTLLCLLAFTATLSYLSWRFVEKPFRDPSRVSTQSLAAFCVTSTALIVCVGIWLKAENGMPERFPFLDGADERMQLARHDNGWCFYSIDIDDQLEVGSNGHRCVLGDKRTMPRVLLFGDSFAGQYEPLWDAIGKLHGFSIAAVTTNWCSPFLDDAFMGPISSRAYDQCKKNKEFLQKNALNYDALILSGTWIGVDGIHKIPETVRLIEWLASHGKKVVVMPSPYNYGTNVNYSFALAKHLNANFIFPSGDSKADALTSTADESLRSAIHGLPGVVFLERSVLFDQHFGDGHLTSEGLPYSLDGAHISVYGAKAIARQLGKDGSDQLVDALFSGSDIQSR